MIQGQGPGQRQGISGPNRNRKLEAFVLGAIALLGLLHLGYPFDGDQAFFTLGAQEINQGAVLYRDFWDIKQPGIFWFYALAGRLFGLNEVGIHTAELLLLLGFSRFLQVSLRDWLGGVAAFTPLLTVGMYYAIATPWHLTQLEAFVGAPIFLVLWLLTQAAQGKGRWQRWRFFAAGLLGGVIVLFKSLLVLILLPMGLVSLAIASLVRRRPFIAGLTHTTWFSLGFGLPLVLTGLYLGSQLQGLDLLYQTFWVYPPRIVAELPGAPISQLRGSLLWFVQQFAPVLGLGLVGAIAQLRQPTLLGINLILWVASGFAVVLLQKQAWWQYYFLLLLVPLGLLAARGIVAVMAFAQGQGQWQWQWAGLDERRFVPTGKRIILGWGLVGIFVFGSPLMAIAHKTQQTLQNTWAAVQLTALAPAPPMQWTYGEVDREVAFLRSPAALPGEIFVAGNPLFYYRAGRTQATSLHGWAMEFLLPEQWVQLQAELAQAQPPYLWIETHRAAVIAQRSPALQTWIFQQYETLRQGDRGTWYRIRAPVVSPL